MILNYEEWTPDSPDFNAPGIISIKNLIPHPYGYRSFPSGVVSSNALTARFQGGISVKDTAGNSFSYAGDATKLYSLPSTTTWTDVSRLAGGAYTIAPDQQWEFAKWGNTVIATNINDVMQVITLGGANFAALAGTPPQARHIAIVRDFVVAGNTNDAVNGVAPNAVRWSAINNSTSWAASASTQSDSQLLQGQGGGVQKVLGGEYGVILTEKSIWRMDYTGTPLVFSFNEVEPSRGCAAPYAVGNLGKMVFFIAEDGFYLFNGFTSTPIGAQKVDRFFFNDVDQNYMDRISIALDTINYQVMWSYPGAGSTAGICNKALIYNWQVNRWGYAEFQSQGFMRTVTPGYTLDNLDSIVSFFDSGPYASVALDSRVWTGGKYVLGYFDTNNKFNTLNGTALDSMADTSESQFFPGYRAMVTNVRPLVDGGATVTVQLGYRDRILDNELYTNAVSVNSTGDCPVRNTARYHRVRTNTSGSFNYLQGVDIDVSREGKR
jgi:hypothetical protein